MTPRRRRVLVVCGALEPSGGGAGVAAWMLEALRRDHDVTLLAHRPPTFAEVDRFFGTRLAEGGVAVELTRAPRIPGLRLALLRQHHIFRAARRAAGRHDVVISNENETWIGRRCIQYVHFPWGYLPRPPIELRWYHQVPAALALYRRLARAISGFRTDLMKTNLTLANSHWTAGKLREWYGMSGVVVLPPPVIGAGTPSPWSERRSGFVMLGRLSREKRVESAVAVLQRVRAAGEPITLCLVGVPDDGPYLERLRPLLDASPWVTRHDRVSRDDLSRILREHRYGIHAMVDEHFGMAVAEMARAGNIVFAHGSGGPREILGDPRLLFADEDDAATKILAVLRDEELQRELSRDLATRALPYSEEHFCETVRELVAAWRY
jgi:glycosyltransferase involved in cell wall biosynthesis